MNPRVQRPPYRTPRNTASHHPRPGAIPAIGDTHHATAPPPLQRDTPTSQGRPGADQRLRLDGPGQLAFMVARFYGWTTTSSSYTDVVHHNLCFRDRSMAARGAGASVRRRAFYEW
ncbi:hypothetical protein GCM10010404_73020 [Nonomuraea africana]